MEPTPDTAPDQFEPVKGRKAKRHTQTGEIWERDLFHGDHWEVYRTKKGWETGTRDRAVWSDGRLKESSNAEGSMAISPDQLCKRYAGKKAKVSLRLLEGEADTILIEGDSDGLEFLGKLILAQARYAKDCGFQISRGGAGSALLNKESNVGLYIHRLHRSGSAKPNRANGRLRKKKEAAARVG